MQLLHSSKCCCCADLRTGGLILGFLGVIGGILRLVSKNPENIIGGLIYGVACAALLYGIYSKKADFLLPAVVLHIIGLCLSVLALVISLIVAIVAKDTIIEFYKKSTGVDITDGYVGCVIAILVIWALMAALAWHFASVVYSLWKNMKEGARPNAMYGA